MLDAIAARNDWQVNSKKKRSKYTHIFAQRWNNWAMCACAISLDYLDLTHVHTNDVHRMFAACKHQSSIVKIENRNGIRRCSQPKNQRILLLRGATGAERSHIVDEMNTKYIQVKMTNHFLLHDENINLAIKLSSPMPNMVIGPINWKNKNINFAMKVQQPIAGSFWWLVDSALDAHSLLWLQTAYGRLIQPQISRRKSVILIRWEVTNNNISEIPKIWKNDKTLN